LVIVESLLREAEEVRQRATESKQFSAAIAAIREMIVLSGPRIERREVGQPGAFEVLSDDELERSVSVRSVWQPIAEVIRGTEMLRSSNRLLDRK
jgi:hypothetical protein